MANENANDWPFGQPPHTRVITLKRILVGTEPIRYVCHDWEEGGWQFLDEDDLVVQNAAMVSLGSMVELDPTIREIAHLPLGYFAWRVDVGEPWNIDVLEIDADDE